MRIILLTPGTGSFYCGTCLRDNALAVALQQLGHDAMMLPLYLPPTLDELPASADAPVFYGGVNVYLQQKFPFFRKTPRWIDAINDSPMVLKIASREAGKTNPAELGDLTLSTLKGELGSQKKELDRLAEWLANEGKPDVILLSNALLIGMCRELKEITGARIYSTLQGEDYFLDLLKEPYRTESWDELSERASELDGLIAVSKYYADTMTERAKLPPDRVSVVHNGILLDGYPKSPRTALSDPPVIGYLARMCDLKGLSLLVDAFIQLKQTASGTSAHLKIVGTKIDADEAYVKSLQKIVAEAGLEECVSWHPNVNRAEKIQLLSEMTLLSVPALYGEAFGLYLIEANGASVPVIQPNHAAFPEVVGETKGGLIVDSLDSSGLAKAMAELLNNPERIFSLGAEGHKSVHRHFGVERMAREVLEVFEKSNA